VSYACEGLEENVQRAVHPTILLDLSCESLRCPVDLVNCVEVVEHVDAAYVDNMMQTLSNGRYVLMTHATPDQEGHHHVNCQPLDYWLEVFGRHGYEVLREHTAVIRKLASTETVATFYGQSGLLFARCDD